MSGWTANGTTPQTAVQLRNRTGLIPLDTQLANGASPQVASVSVDVLGGIMTFSNLAITAFAGGGQASATQLGMGINVVTVVATAADSVKLPPAFAGALCFVKNADGADSMTVFGFGTDTIDAVASATGNAQAAGKGKLYFGTSGNGDGVAGTWVSLLGA